MKAEELEAALRMPPPMRTGDQVRAVDEAARTTLELLPLLEKLEAEIKLAAYACAGDPSKQDEMKMYLSWAGQLAKIVKGRNQR